VAANPTKGGSRGDTRAGGKEINKAAAKAAQKLESGSSIFCREEGRRDIIREENKAPKRKGKVTSKGARAMDRPRAKGGGAVVGKADSE